MSFPGAEYFWLRGPHACGATVFMCVRQMSCERGMLKRGSCCVSAKACWKVVKPECVLVVTEGDSQFTQNRAAFWQRM